MKILLDHCVPKPFKREIPSHEISTAKELGWEAFTNGKLIDAAQANGFEALITVDQNLTYQQNLTARNIIICVLVAPGITVEDLRPLVPPLEKQLSEAKPGHLYEIKA